MTRRVMQGGELGNERNPLEDGELGNERKPLGGRGLRKASVPAALFLKSVRGQWVPYRLRVPYLTWVPYSMWVPYE